MIRDTQGGSLVATVAGLSDLCSLVARKGVSRIGGGFFAGRTMGCWLSLRQANEVAGDSMNGVAKKFSNDGTAALRLGRVWFLPGVAPRGGATPGFACGTPLAFGRRGFTLIELLVVVAIVGVLASLLLPALARAKGSSKRATCLSNLRQVGLGFSMYAGDHEGRFPDRRDLKLALGYMPWTSWPPSDPRSGWAAVCLKQYITDVGVWSCPALRSSPLAEAPQSWQNIGVETNSPVARYWLWRFDRAEPDVPLDNFWGKTEEACVSDLRLANNPQVGIPNGAAEVELGVDPYFPRTIASLPDAIRGRAVHPNGRNRLFLDGHVAFLRDARTR